MVLDQALLAPWLAKDFIHGCTHPLENSKRIQVGAALNELSHKGCQLQGISSGAVILL